MRTLGSVARQGTDMAEALPTIISSFDKADMKVRRGQLTMLAALPGHGKTWLTLFLVVRWFEKFGLTCLYFSADSDEMTMAVRAGAIVNREDQSVVEQKVRDKDSAVLESLDNLKRGVQFSFQSNPSYSHIDRELQAFNIVYGDYPDVVVVDNLMNIEPTAEDETTSFKDGTKALEMVAHTTGSAVLVLHHLAESYVKVPEKPAPVSCIAGKVSQTPAVVYTLAFEREASRMHLACVKNRSGKASPSAEQYVTVGANPERMLIGADPNAALTGGWA